MAAQSSLISESRNMYTIYGRAENTVKDPQYKRGENSCKLYAQFTPHVAIRNMNNITFYKNFVKTFCTKIVLKTI